MAEHHHHHHSRRSPEQLKKDKTLTMASRLLMLAAIAVLIPYLAMEFVPFMVSITTYKKVNMTTMCYTTLRLMLVFVPILIALPESWLSVGIKIQKISLLSKWFAVISFLYLMGMVVDIMSYNVLSGYIDKNNDPIMLKMLWGNIGINGIAFCFLQGVGYLLLWKKINGHRKEVLLYFLATYLLYLILPLATLRITGGSLALHQWSMWLDKNIWFFISNTLLFAALVVASRSRRVWSKLIWN